MEHNYRTAQHVGEAAAMRKIDQGKQRQRHLRMPGRRCRRDPSDLREQLQEARREASQNYDRYIRVHADMENYKKRIERTYADLTRNAKKDLLLKLLGVKDNLERALSYGDSNGEPGQNESIIQGVRLTEYQLDQLLRSEGVTPMDLRVSHSIPSWPRPSAPW